VNDAGAKHWYGTFTDIQDIKDEVELHKVKSEELTHRLKNVLTVTSSLVRMSAYEFPEAKHFSDLLQNRIAALACTYPHVRFEDFGNPEQEATVHSLIKRLTEGYEGFCKSRFLVHGPDTLIGPTASFALALILQELLTNAAKYGALSTQDGQVKISCLQDDDCFHLVWLESNGSEPLVLPQRYGFGTKLIDRAQKIIAADCKLDWRPDGLCFSLDVHPSQLEK
jgi:two-component sensor histidine kinase